MTTPLKRIEEILNAAKECQVLRTGAPLSADPSWRQTGRDHLAGRCEHGKGEPRMTKDDGLLEIISSRLLNIRDSLVSNYGYIDEATSLMELRDLVRRDGSVQESHDVVEVPLEGTLAANLRWHREQTGLTQYALGKELGLKGATLKRIEDGETTHPHEKTVRLLCDYFDIEPSDLDPGWNSR